MQNTSRRRAVFSILALAAVSCGYSPSSQAVQSPTVTSVPTIASVRNATPPTATPFFSPTVPPVALSARSPTPQAAATAASGSVVSLESVVRREATHLQHVQYLASVPPVSDAVERGIISGLFLYPHQTDSIVSVVNDLYGKIGFPAPGADWVRNELRLSATTRGLPVYAVEFHGVDSQNKSTIDFIGKRKPTPLIVNDTIFYAGFRDDRDVRNALVVEVKKAYDIFYGLGKGDNLPTPQKGLVIELRAFYAGLVDAFKDAKIGVSKSYLIWISYKYADAYLQAQGLSSGNSPDARFFAGEIAQTDILVRLQQGKIYIVPDQKYGISPFSIENAPMPSSKF